jgi:hypothetical protein
MSAVNNRKEPAVKSSLEDPKLPEAKRQQVCQPALRTIHALSDSSQPPVTLKQLQAAHTSDASDGALHLVVGNPNFQAVVPLLFVKDRPPQGESTELPVPEEMVDLASIEDSNDQEERFQTLYAEAFDLLERANAEIDSDSDSAQAVLLEAKKIVKTLQGQISQEESSFSSFFPLLVSKMQKIEDTLSNKSVL